MVDGGKWVTISNPDDFHQHGVTNLDIDVINKGLRKIQILKDLELPKLPCLTVSLSIIYYFT